MTPQDTPIIPVVDIADDCRNYLFYAFAHKNAASVGLTSDVWDWLLDQWWAGYTPEERHALTTGPMIQTWACWPGHVVEQVPSKLILRTIRLPWALVTLPAMTPTQRDQLWTRMPHRPWTLDSQRHLAEGDDISQWLRDLFDHSVHTHLYREEETGDGEWPACLRHIPWLTLDIERARVDEAIYTITTLLKHDDVTPHLQAILEIMPELRLPGLPDFGDKWVYEDREIYKAAERNGHPPERRRPLSERTRAKYMAAWDQLVPKWQEARAILLPLHAYARMARINYY